MAESYLGEIKLVGFNFAPQGWTEAAGQLLAISQYNALFALVGTTYGGNGTSNFQLPDLRGRTPIGIGNGQVQGEPSGTEQVTLLLTQYPQHNHLFSVNTVGGLGLPTNNFLASVSATSPPPPTAGHIYTTGAANQPLNPASLSTYPGQSLPHENMQPNLVMNYIIALTGIFPSRN